MGDEAIVVQIIHQICDLRETFAFHNNKSTDHGFFGEAPPPGCRSGQREVQAAEKLVVERSGALGCEQCYILNDFLSVDSGQPLSGWLSLKSILPKRGSAFYIYGVISGFSHGREPLQLLLFWSFAHGCCMISDEQNRQKEQPTNRRMGIKRAWGISRAQKP